jgi:hypothetical protein
MNTEAVLIPVSETENEWDTLEDWAISAAPVVALMTQQRRLAEAKMREEKLRLSVWQEYLTQQQDEIEQSRRFRTQLRADLRALHLTPIITPRPMRGKTPEALWITQLNGLEKLFEQLLNHGMDETDSSLVPLQQQTQYFIKQLDSVTPPAADVIKSFFGTVQTAINAHLDNQEEQEMQHKQILKQTELLLESLITYQHLTDNSAQIQNLMAIQQNMLEPGAITADILALFEQQTLSLKTSIDETRQNAAIQTGLIQTLHQQLTRMGYELVDDTMEPQTVWRIPGGELMTVKMQNRYQITFQLRHERASYREEGLTDDEKAFFVQQQSRWSTDLQKLPLFFKKDGFNYHLQFQPKSRHISIMVTE